MRLPARIAQNRIVIGLLISFMLFGVMPFNAAAATDIGPGQTAIVTGTGGDPTARPGGPGRR